MSALNKLWGAIVGVILGALASKGVDAAFVSSVVMDIISQGLQYILPVIAVYLAPKNA